MVLKNLILIVEIGSLEKFHHLQLLLSSKITLLNFKFKQIHACNTLPVEKGGLSGKELIPYTEKFIKHIKHHFPQVEVIAGGGIDSLEDIQNYANIGADHVSLGTVCFNPLKLRKLV